MQTFLVYTNKVESILYETRPKHFQHGRHQTDVVTINDKACCVVWRFTFCGRALLIKWTYKEEDQLTEANPRPLRRSFLNHLLSIGTRGWVASSLPFQTNQFSHLETSLSSWRFEPSTCGLTAQHRNHRSHWHVKIKRPTD